MARHAILVLYLRYYKIPKFSRPQHRTVAIFGLENPFIQHISPKYLLSLEIFYQKGFKMPDLKN
jgi:hypothetical protein